MNTNELSDDFNPVFLYSCTAKDLLVQIASGKIDPVQLAKQELQKRGCDDKGKWVGFK